MALSFGPLYQDFYGDLKKRREEEAVAKAQGVKLPAVQMSNQVKSRASQLPKQNVWDLIRDTFDANTDADVYRRFQSGQDNNAPRQSNLDKIRDVFDANTALDRYNRIKAGQSADYVQQQKELGNPNATTSPIPSVLTNFIQGTTKTLGLAGRAGEMTPEQAKKNQELYDQGSQTTMELRPTVTTKDAQGNTIYASKNNVVNRNIDQQFTNPADAAEATKTYLEAGVKAKLMAKNPFGGKTLIGKMAAEGGQNVLFNAVDQLTADDKRSIQQKAIDSVTQAPEQFLYGIPYGLLPGQGGKAKVKPTIEPPKVSAPKVDIPTVKVQSQPTVRPVVTGPSAAPVKPQVEAPQVGKTDNIVYHGKGVGGSETGDRYGKGLYVTSDKKRAIGYANGGAVDEYSLDGSKLANLDDKVDSKIVDILKREINDSIKNGDDYYKNAIRMSVGEKTFSKTDIASARNFVDEQRAIASKLGLGEDSMPITKKNSDGSFTITYVDDTLESLKNIDGNRLFRSLPTPTAQSLFTAAGFDGVSYRGLGGDIESVVYNGKLNKSTPPQVGKAEIPKSNQRQIDSAATNKPMNEFKVGERVSFGTAQGGTASGKITKTPDFTKDLRFKGNDFKVKLDDGTIVTKLGTDFKAIAPTAPQVGKTKVATKAVVEPPKVAEAPAPVATRSVDEILYGDQPKIAERGRSVAQTLSPDRLIREKITNPLEEAAQRVIYKMQTSKNPIARATVKPLAGFSREAGVTKELMQAKRSMRGGIEKGKLNREAIAELGDGFSRESRERVWATLDPEQAQKIGLDIPAASQLTPEEVQLQSTLKEIIDSTTEGNLRRGLITVEQADKGDYLKRGYSIFEGDAANNKAYKATRKNLLDQYKGRKEITDELIDEAITDPVYLVAKKQAESEAAWAMHDYGSFIVEKGMASPTKRPGYRQLPNNPLYGPAAGQYVPINIAEDFTGFSYDTGIINAFNDLITAYDSLGIRRAKKELLTVFNPAVRAGNQFSNRAVFANMNGINPVQFQKNYLEAGKQIKAKGQYYREAVEQGLTGIDVTQADFHARVAQYADDPNMAQKALDWTKRSYSAADDKARVAAYITWRKRGLSAEEAGRKVQRGFQDYKSVGFFYDMAAKTPLIGNAFVRFAGDAIRIAKNSALDHPLRTVATIMLWSTFVDAMSKFSGESEQDKQTREDRFGAPKIPFTDISMTVQTPMGEINVARFLPFYQLNEIQGPLARFLPIQADPTKPEGWQDPLLGQVAQLVADKDFRGKSIKDPENTGQFSEPLSPEQERMNQARFLATQNLPLGREADSIISAAMGVPDIYGKERSLGQAALRAGGIKVEEFGPEQAAKQRSKNQYFDEKAKIDEQLSKMTPAEQEAYKRLTGYYKLREKVPNEFEAGAMRYKKTPVFAFPEDKWKDYTANPNIYSFMEQKKNDEAKRGVPLQPEFDKRLSLEFRKQLINNKSLAPGEDVEADERMYSNPEWDKYQEIKKEYTEKAKKYYPEKDGEFVDELVKHKTADFPQKPKAKADYDAAYANFVAGKGPKPAFTDAVAAAKEQYTQAKLDWTNAERKARELPPINPDVWNNVTFGFESDEEKVAKALYFKGKSGDGYGSGGSNKVSMKNIYSYGSGLTPRKAKAQTVKKIAAPKVKIASSKTTKPKVTIKKSKV